MFQLRMFVALALTAAASVAQLERVAYRVAYKSEVRDRAFVQATFFGQGEPPSAVEIPRWSPGAYELKDFAKFLENVAAVDGAGREVAVARVEDASRWTLASKDATWPIVVSYERLDQAEGLMSNRPKARAANYVSFLPTNTFVYAVGGKDVPHEVAFDVPEGWLVAMALPRGDGPHVFKAPNYDEIVDAPVEMGHLTIRNFTVGDATYALVIDRRDPKFPLQSVEDLLRRIIRHQVGMFGGAPFTHYEVHLHEGVGWGLEHLTSQTDAVPMRLIRDNGPGVFDSLFAHEFFHLWNVKRLRPKALGPFDYQAPCRTKHLWFSEGVTDYYADLTCRRTGLWNDRKWWESWGGEVNRLQGMRIRFDEPIATTSWLAFDRGYAAQIFGRGLDYYNKGKILGLLLDLVIRKETGGARSLDDVMRALYAKYAYPKPGFDDDALVGEMSAAAGVDLKEFFRRYVEGTSELPYADVLASVGVETRGVREPNPALAERLATAEGLEVVDGRFVFRDASVFGESEGLKDGDVLTKVEGVEAHTSEGRALGDLFAAVGGDHVYEIVVKRGAAEVPLTITLPLAGRRTFRRDAKASEDAKAAYAAWLADVYTEKVQPGETKDTLGLE